MSLVNRVVRKISREIDQKKTDQSLEENKIKFGSEDIYYIEYPWIKLIYSHDGDTQEYRYHKNCLSYYANEMPVFLSILKRDDTIIDVGANMGFMTTLFSSIVGPEGKIFSFEPSPKTYNKLQNTIRINDLKNVETFNMGCGPEKSTMLLQSISDSSGHNTLTKQNSSKVVGTVEVQITPLDEVEKLFQQKINVIKIDTEGFEPNVLLGAKKLIELHKPILHIEMGGDYTESTHQTLQILKDYNYRTNQPDNLDWKKIGNGVNFLCYPNR